MLTLKTLFTIVMTLWAYALWGVGAAIFYGGLTIGGFLVIWKYGTERL
jgi:hypothetical protein